MRLTAYCGLPRACLVLVWVLVCWCGVVCLDTSKSNYKTHIQTRQKVIDQSVITHVDAEEGQAAVRVGLLRRAPVPLGAVVGGAYVYTCVREKKEKVSE